MSRPLRYTRWQAHLWRKTYSAVFIGTGIFILVNTQVLQTEPSGRGFVIGVILLLTGFARWILT